MGRNTIVTCAVTGNLTTRQQHLELPLTPEEIARAAVEAGRAGAAGFTSMRAIRPPRPAAPTRRCLPKSCSAYLTPARRSF